MHAEKKQYLEIIFIFQIILEKNGRAAKVNDPQLCLQIFYRMACGAVILIDVIMFSRDHSISFI